STPYEITRNSEIYPMEEIMEACDLVTKENVTTKEIVEKFQHNNGFVRFWAVVAVECLEKYDSEIIADLIELLKDEFVTVQIEAAKILIKAGNTEFADLIINYLDGEDKIVQLYAARAFEETWMLLPNFPEKVYTIYSDLKESTAGKWYGHDLYAFWSLSQVFKDENIKAPAEVNYGK
ncbi:MAG: HEAT repeat domain-containing protein, partial [Draconibacterium sp.]|nr:HEAT repeat domain-containing protein [Draconibacterium sp.]